MSVEEMMDLQSVKLPEGSVLGMYLVLDDTPQTLLLSAESEEAEAVLIQYHESGRYFGFYPNVNQIDKLPGSQITCLFQESFVAEQIRGHMVTYLMIIGVFVLTVLVCSYLAGAMLTVRVTRFIEKMNNELDMILITPSMTVIEDSDFQGIEKRIRKLILSTQEYYTKLEQYETEKNRLELELLQMRFNPHFLYNTLTSIRYQVKDQRIRKSIDSLIRYYRIVLSKGHLMIRIEEEIAMIWEYLELQVFAYQLEHVSYEFDIDERVKSFTIIKHLLQPIVENALEHGLRVREGEGIIRIRARLTPDDIVFEIEDNGAGMTPEQIAHVLSEPTGGSVGGGYGIYNVQQRIETYYGKGYGLVFRSTPGEGTCVTLRIPQK